MGDDPEPPFFPTWTVDRPHPDSFVVKDNNGIVVATVHCRDDLQKWSFGHSKLTSDEPITRGELTHAVARENDQRGADREWICSLLDRALAVGREEGTTEARDMRTLSRLLP
jgi:hypothetical protein